MFVLSYVWIHAFSGNFNRSLLYIHMHLKISYFSSLHLYYTDVMHCFISVFNPNVTRSITYVKVTLIFLIQIHSHMCMYLYRFYPHTYICWVEGTEAGVQFYVIYHDIFFIHCITEWMFLLTEWIYTSSKRWRYI